MTPDPLPRDDARDQPLALRLWQPLLHVNNYAGFGAGVAGKDLAMLRKLLWTGLYASFAAAATMAARRAASRVWRVATGEEPPTKK